MTEEILGNLFIKNYDGTTYTLHDVRSNSKILEVKIMFVKHLTKINNINKVNMNKFRFVFAGKILDNNKTLQDYQIKNESTIHSVAKLANTIIPENTNLTNKLINLKDKLSRFEEENALVYINFSTPILNWNKEFQEEIINNKFIELFLNKEKRGSMKLLLFNPEYVKDIGKIQTEFDKITGQKSIIISDDDPYFYIFKTPTDYRLEIYLSKFNLHHHTNLHPNKADSNFRNITLFNYLNDELFYDSISILYKLYQYPLYLKRKYGKTIEFPQTFIRDLLLSQSNGMNGGSKKYHKLRNGSKRLIKIGPNGGKYYIKNKKKVYIK